jgi:hypothetical protein
MSARERTNSGSRIVESETEAKQGVELHRVRYVLLFGLGGAILALGIAALIFMV